MSSGRRRRHPLAKIKGGWTEEEDQLLIRLVQKLGEGNWSPIARSLNDAFGKNEENGRIGKQCRERWNHHLRPDIKKDAWSEGEEKLLVEAHKQLGNRWSDIAKVIPGRTENAVKNHWNATLRRKANQTPSDGDSCTTASAALKEYMQSINLLGSIRPRSRKRKQGSSLKPDGEAEGDGEDPMWEPKSKAPASSTTTMSLRQVKRSGSSAHLGEAEGAQARPDGTVDGQTLSGGGGGGGGSGAGSKDSQCAGRSADMSCVSSRQHSEAQQQQQLRRGGLSTQLLLSGAGGGGGGGQLQQQLVHARPVQCVSRSGCGGDKRLPATAQVLCPGVQLQPRGWSPALYKVEPHSYPIGAGGAACMLQPAGGELQLQCRVHQQHVAAMAAVSAAAPAGKAVKPPAELAAGSGVPTAHAQDDTDFENTLMWLQSLDEEDHFMMNDNEIGEMDFLNKPSAPITMDEIMNEAVAPTPPPVLQHSEHMDTKHSADKQGASSQAFSEESCSGNSEGTLEGRRRVQSQQQLHELDTAALPRRTVHQQRLSSLTVTTAVPVAAAGCSVRTCSSPVESSATAGKSTQGRGLLNGFKPSFAGSGTHLDEMDTDDYMNGNSGSLQHSGSLQRSEDGSFCRCASNSRLLSLVSPPATAMSSAAGAHYGFPPQLGSATAIPAAMRAVGSSTGLLDITTNWTAQPQRQHQHQAQQQNPFLSGAATGCSAPSTELVVNQSSAPSPPVAQWHPDVVMVTTQQLPTLVDVLGLAGSGNSSMQQVATFCSSGPQRIAADRMPPALRQQQLDDHNVCQVVHTHLHALCQGLRVRWQLGRVVVALRLGVSTPQADRSLVVAVAAGTWEESTSAVQDLVNQIKSILQLGPT